MFKAAVLTVSDRSFRGERPDAGGPLVVEILKNAGYTVTETAIVPVIRKPLFHEGGGLVSLPVCDPACDLLDRNTAVLQSIGRNPTHS